MQDSPESPFGDRRARPADTADGLVSVRRGDHQRGAFSATGPIPSNFAAHLTAASSYFARGHSLGDQMECPIGAIRSPSSLRSAASNEMAVTSCASWQLKDEASTFASAQDSDVTVRP